MNAIVSGGYDIPADQVDLRAALAPTTTGTAAGHPEIQLFAVGTPDGLSRSVDVAALSSWLAVRAIDRETRRLDAIERGEPPPPVVPTPALIPPQDRLQETPDLSAALPALADVPIPGRDPRKHVLETEERRAASDPAARHDCTEPIGLRDKPVAIGAVAAAIEVRPAPGAPARPKPRPPLVLTPQVANPPPRPALQN